MNTIFDKATAKFAGLLIDLIQKLKNGVISIDQLFFFLNMSRTDRDQMCGTKNLLSFLIGDIFKHRDNTTSVLQWFGDNFKAWLWNPSKEKTISIPTNMEKLREYVLPSSMNDTKIQKNTSSTQIDEDTFWIILYYLIIKPEQGLELLDYECKKDGTVYLMHVKLADGRVVSFYFDWDDVGWNLDAHSFVRGGDWYEDDVFLFFATGS